MSTQTSSTAIHLTRRCVLGAACALAAVAPALAQQIGSPGRVKGPKVFLDYDQVELDAAYDQGVYAPNRDQILMRYATNSELTRARIGTPMRTAYGPSEIEKLDIYRAKGAKAPIQIFIHGGAWRSGRAKDFAFAAETFLAAGAHFVVPDFVWVQDAGGRLTVMADQVRRAIAWVRQNATSFGGDPDRIFLSGHSSGAHLASVALVTDWQKEFGLPADMIKGALCVSGLYDLKGPRLSARSSYVNFDDATEEALSSQRHLDKLRTPVVIAYASLDTPEFQRQSRDFAAALQSAGKPARLLLGENYNHFEFIETLANPYGLLGRAALEQMKLAPA
jgi:arylformamidase